MAALLAREALAGVQAAVTALRPHRVTGPEEAAGCGPECGCGGGKWGCPRRRLGGGDLRCGGGGAAVSRCRDVCRREVGGGCLLRSGECGGGDALLRGWHPGEEMWGSTMRGGRRGGVQE